MRRFSQSSQSSLSQALRVGLLCLVLVGVVPERQPFRPVTVCEVQADPVAFDGRTVALLGVLSQGPEWPYVIEDCGTKSAHDISYSEWPEQVNAERFVLDRTEFERKFSKIRTTTELRLQRRYPSLWRQGKVREQWAIVYGRIESRHRNGYRALDGARARIAGVPILLNEDGSPAAGAWRVSR